MTATWSLSEMTSYYTKYAENYDDDISVETYPAPFIIGRWCVAHLQPLPPPCSILDLGCGTGQSSVPFFAQPDKSKYRIIGVDATEKMIEKAKKYPFTQLICQDIEQELDCEGRVFDAIVCVGVIDFIQNVPQFLNRCRRLLKSPSSCLGLSFPEGGDLNSFTFTQIQSLLTDAGFNIIQHQQVLGYKDSQSGEETHYHCFLVHSA